MRPWNVRPCPYGVLMTAAAALPDPGRDTALLSASGPLDAARAAVAEALVAGVWSRSEPELVADLRETLALRAQVDALLLTQIAEVDSRGLAGRRGARRRGPGCVRRTGSERARLPGWSAPR